MAEFTRIVTTREQAHQAITDSYAVAQALLSDGKRVRLAVATQEDDRSLRQNRYYWAACLGEISEQASINGQRWSSDAWHELFKRQFIGYEIEKVKVAGRKRTTVIRRLRSTTKLSVRAMSTYLEQVQAFAATELGVQFSLLDWQEYQG